MVHPNLRLLTRRIPVMRGRRWALGALSGVVVSATADPFALAKKKHKRRHKKKQKRPARCPGEAAECRQFVTRYCTILFPELVDDCTADLSRCCDLVEPCDLDLATQCFADLIGPAV